MCSLYGLLDYGNVISAYERQNILRILGKECEERGTDATGIACFDGKQLIVQKAPKPARKFRFNVPPNSRFLMGHTRMTTQGDEKRNYNNHPFQGVAGNMPFALAHNGVIWNDIRLQQSKLLPRTKIETDSYVAVQLLEQIGKISFDSLRAVAEQLQGSFTITVLAREGLHIIRGNNPLCVYHFPALGVYAYASTEEILRRALSKTLFLHRTCEKIPLAQGEILKIDTRGEVSRDVFNDLALLTQWGYGYLNGFDNTPRRSAYAPHRSEHEQLLLEYAEAFGVPEYDVELLLDVGYDANDIEELLYDDAARKTCLEEIREMCF